MSSRPPPFVNSVNAECSCPFVVATACLAIVETGIPPAVAAEGFYRRPFLHGHQLRYLNLQIFTDMFLFYMLISDSFILNVFILASFSLHLNSRAEIMQNLTLCDSIVPVHLLPPPPFGIRKSCRA